MEEGWAVRKDIPGGDSWTVACGHAAGQTKKYRIIYYIYTLYIISNNIDDNKMIKCVCVTNTVV